MLIGKIGKAFEPSPYRPAKDLGKHCRQEPEEHYAEDRGEHRGVDHQPSKGGFLTPHIAANIVSLWHPKVAAKSEGY